MFGDDEGEERPGMKAKKKVKISISHILFVFCGKLLLIFIFSGIFSSFLQGSLYIIKTLFFVPEIFNLSLMIGLLVSVFSLLSAVD